MTHQSANHVYSEIIGKQLRIKLNDHSLFILHQPLERSYRLILENTGKEYTIGMDGYTKLYITDDVELAQRIMDVTADALANMASKEEATTAIAPQKPHYCENNSSFKWGVLISSVILVGILMASILVHLSDSSPDNLLPPSGEPIPKQLSAPPAHHGETTPLSQMLPSSRHVEIASQVNPQPEKNTVISPSDIAEARQLLATRLKNGAAKQEFTIQLSSGHPRTLYIFSDPECPNCRIFEPTVQALSAQYNVEIFPVTLIGKARTAEQVVPLLCAPAVKRADMWRSIFDIGAGMLNPTAKSEPKPASCEAGQNALARNDMAFELYHLPGTPTVISDDGRMIPLQAMTSDAALQAFLNSAQ